MNSLNSVLLEGNLVEDPSLSDSPTSPVCRFQITSERFYKQNDELEKETNSFDIEAWSRLGQTCADTLKKGRGVRVVGRLTQRKWTDTDGKDHFKVIIVAEHVEFKLIHPVPESNEEDEDDLL